MPLSAGSQLGPYEVLSPIGAGGMGEVYKARDTRLDRTVAIKVLPEHIAKREDLRARFEREARAVASLNHPNICVLHDIGNQDGTGYMVMEFMEGETLASRIEKGALPLDQALKFAIQIADALDRAHRAGVTHRDIKPQNIIITRDGVKVLDFGLAKSTAKPGPTDATIVKSLTTEGTVLGTPQYMAPEQFEGEEADARSDIWAFGAVLYEMVTGQKAFQGKSYSSLVGAILATDPAPMAVQPFTPRWLERLVRRCLAKDPDDRWQTMRDVVIELRTPPAETAGAAKASPLPWMAVATVTTLALLATLAVHFREKPAEPPTLTTSILPPDKTFFEAFNLSPDGRLLAFVSSVQGKRQLWVRPLRASSAQLLAGTEGAENPFWSPDSRWIGYFAQGKMKKIEAAGGPPQNLCDVGGYGSGGTWNADGVIVFSQTRGGLWRVAAQGGVPTQLRTIDRSRGHSLHFSAVFLPGGRRFLYLAEGNSEADQGIYWGAMDSQEGTRLVGDLSRPGYAEGPAGEGYLLFVRQGTLMAQRLDAEKGTISGEPFPVAEKVSRFSVSGNGLLVYQSGFRPPVQLTWTDRGGKRLETVGEETDSLLRMGLSADEKHVAYQVKDDIWLRDLERGIATRLTFRGGNAPVWSPDGTRVAFQSASEGISHLYVKSSGGAGQEQVLLKSEFAKVVTDWGGGGRLVLYSEYDPKLRDDLWILPMEGEKKPLAFLRTEFHERQGAFAPDAKWIAYTSDESGRDEIYLQPYPATGVRWQVSKDGGHWPRWRRDGNELYWLAENGTMMATEVSLGPMMKTGNPYELFYLGVTHPFERFAVSGDGKRFLVPIPLDQGQGRPVTLVQNWLAGAKR